MLILAGTSAGAAILALFPRIPPLQVVSTTTGRHASLAEGAPPPPRALSPAPGSAREGTRRLAAEGFAHASATRLGRHHPGDSPSRRSPARFTSAAVALVEGEYGDISRHHPFQQGVERAPPTVGCRVSASGDLAHNFAERASSSPPRARENSPALIARSLAWSAGIRHRADRRRETEPCQQQAAAPARSRLASSPPNPRDHSNTTATKVPGAPASSASRWTRRSWSREIGIGSAA